MSESVLGFTATFENSRARCGFVAKSASTYDLTCRISIFDSVGSEFPAQSIDPSLRTEWKMPVSIEGSPITVLSCQDPFNQLSRTCTVSLDAPDKIAKVRTDLELKDLPTQRTKTESDVVLLGYSVRTYGYSPQVGRMYATGGGNFVTRIRRFFGGKSSPAYGFQTVTVDAPSTAFGVPYSMCSRDGAIYFSAMTGAIYALKDGQATLYAGSPNVSHLQEFSHRLRVKFGTTTIAPIGLACAEDGIYAADTMNSRVLKLYDDGPVELIAGKVAGSFPDNVPAVEALIDRPLGLDLTLDNLFIYARDVTYRVDLTGKIFLVNPSGTRTLGVKVGNQYILAADRFLQRKLTLDGNPANVVDFNTGFANPRRIVGFGKGKNNSVLVAVSNLDFSTNATLYRWNTDTNSLSAPIGTFLNSNFSPVQQFLGMPYIVFGIVETDDGIFFANAHNHRLDRLTNGVVTLVAGRSPTNPRDPVLADLAQEMTIEGVAPGLRDEVFFYSYKVTGITSEPLIKQVRKNGIQKDEIRVIAGNGYFPAPGETPAFGWVEDSIATEARLQSLYGIAVANDEVVYFSDRGLGRIGMLYESQGIWRIRTAVGLSTAACSSSSYDGPAQTFKPCDPGVMAKGPDGTIYYYDGGFIRKLYMNNGVLFTKDVGRMPFSNSLAVGPNETFYYTEVLANQTRLTRKVGSTATVLHTDTILGGLGVAPNGSVIVTHPLQGTVLRLLPNATSATGFSAPEVLFGGATGKDCGVGNIEGESVALQLEDSLKASVAKICSGRPFALAVTANCANNPEGKVSTLYAQSYGDASANIVKATRACLPGEQ